MKTNQIKIKLIDANAALPSRANKDDACFDLVAIDDGVASPCGRYIEYGTGIQMEPPKGYAIDLRPRSSISKYDLIMANGPGTGDAGYRGEYKVRFKSTYDPQKFNDAPKYYKKGDKIVQFRLIQTNNIEFIATDTLSDTVRGAGGFGSSGQ